jgi:hypothetical protein
MISGFDALYGRLVCRSSAGSQHLSITLLTYPSPEIVSLIFGPDQDEFGRRFLRGIEEDGPISSIRHDLRYLQEITPHFHVINTLNQFPHLCVSIVGRRQQSSK